MSSSTPSVRRGAWLRALGVAHPDPAAPQGDEHAGRRELASRLRFEEPESQRGRMLWLVLALVAAALVAVLAVAVGNDSVQARDLSLLTALHDRLVAAGIIGVADEIADGVSVWLGPGPHLLPLTALAAFLAWRAGRLRLALFVPLAFAGGLLGERLLKVAIDRPRPNLYPAIASVSGPSFPSGHAVGAICAVAVPLLVMAWLTRRRWLRVTLVATAVVAVVAIDLARLVLAVHWPTDVIAGNLVGLAFCGALAAALGLPLPAAQRTAGGDGLPPARGLAGWWGRLDPDRPGAHPGVEANRRLTALAGALLVPVLTLVILSGLFFGSAPVLHFFVGFVAIPLTLLKLGSTGWRMLRYYLGRDARYRAAGPPTPLPRILAPALVASAAVAFVSGVILFVEGTKHGVVSTLHTDSAVVFVIAVVLHLAIHARSAYLGSTAELTRQTAVAGTTARRATLVAACVAGVVIATGLTIAIPWPD